MNLEMVKRRTTLIIIYCLLFVLSANAGLYSVRVLIDEEDADTVVQGTPFWLEIIIDPGDTFSLTVIVDLDGDRMFSADDRIFVRGIMHDNTTREDYDESPIALDYDTTLGRVLFFFPFSISPGGYIFLISQDADTITDYILQIPPDPLLYSISGIIEIEDRPPPDSLYEMLVITGYDEDDMFFIVALIDSMGNYTLNWPFEPALFSFVVSIIDEDTLLNWFNYSLGYDLDDEPETTFFVNRHHTGLNFLVPLWKPDTLHLIYHAVDNFNNPIDIDSLLILRLSDYLWDDDSGFPVLVSLDSLYLDCVDGLIEKDFAMPRLEYIEGALEFFNFPSEMLKSNTNLDIYLFADNPETLVEHFDTFYIKNDSLWIRYSYDMGLTPLDIELPFTVQNYRFGYTEVSIPRDSTCGVWIYSAPGGPTWDNSYQVSFAADTALPGNYGFYQGNSAGISVRDTLQLLMGLYDVSLTCSLLSFTGEIVNEHTLLVLDFNYPTGTDYCIFSFEFDTGLVEMRLFSGIEYTSRINISNLNYMIPPHEKLSFESGTYNRNIYFYPLDTTYWLYLNIDSDEPIDESLSVMMLSPDGQHSSSANFPTNRWQEMPIYSGFDDSCRIRITNRFRYSPYYGFSRLIENNGNIPVTPGDSIYLIAELPVDEFIMEFKRDTADSWQYPIGPNRFTIDYYSLADTELVYQFIPPRDAGMSLDLPIFEEQMLVKVEVPFNISLHHFLANPDDYLRVGGPYRPDRVRRRLNSGTGEMLLTLEGYPSEYLGDDTVFYPRGNFYGVETPDYPGYQYIANLFFFGTTPYRHPYGDGSVMAFHDVCDGQWTVILPDTLPGGFIPT
ncbi:hypothetical protein JW877_07700, partial [bacterium]|nr:hypothetical protein [bacterium]